jgi:two-component system alkaline phosphatase synthesis response regulator PhoP
MNETLLVIDDDPSLVNLMTSNFEELGYRVISGYDGQAAINMARTHKPHLIILDVNMPMTNGLKAMEVIRENLITREIPIILLTGETSERVFPQVQGAERVTHVKKPIDLEELNSLVSDILQKRPPPSK